MFVSGRKYPDGTVAGEYTPGSGDELEGEEALNYQQGLDFTQTVETLVSSDN